MMLNRAFGGLYQAVKTPVITTARRGTMGTLAFAQVSHSQPDFMQELKKVTEADTSLNKIDLGAGVYRNDQGQYHEFQTLKKAKQRLHLQPANHDYNPTTGIKAFCDAAVSLMFGPGNPLIREGKIASVQTVAGTGANRIGAAFLRRNWRLSYERKHIAYVGIPSWPNYQPLFENAGFEVRTYDHFRRGERLPAVENVIKVAESAPEGSIFIFQGCCHNPTGLDYDRCQWSVIADALLAGQHFAFFDTAYQGFGSGTPDGVEDDAWAVRYFANLGVDMLVCQSFSKNMGLYSERVGALHVVCKRPEIAANVFDQLRAQIRWEVSSAPAYGANLVQIILNDETLCQEWQAELGAAASRIFTNRTTLHQLLTEKYRTPGYWDHIINERGLFSYPTLTEAQVSKLISEHHIYLPPTGRINIAGLRDVESIERAAAAIDAVVRVY